MDNGEEVAEWFLTQRRVKAPLHVRVRSTDLDGAAAYWVRVTGLDDPIAVTRVDAQVIQPGEIQVDTQNVVALKLSPPPELRNGTQPLLVVWNGEEQRLPVATDGTVSLSKDTADKRPGLAGSLSNFITTPFAIVYGTSSADPVMNLRCKAKGEALAIIWEQWQHQKPRIFADQQLTPEDERRYSLLLIGGADANLVARRMQSQLPLVVDSDAVTIAGTRFPAVDAVAQMIYPSPAAADRYVLEVAATSSAGMYFWNPGGLWFHPFGYPTERFDWTIRDGRQVKLDTGLGAERGWIASGTFDRHWHRDDHLVFLGDETLRAHSPLRKAPAVDFRVAAATLSSYAGRYEVAPGVIARIVLQGSDTLRVEAPDGSTTPMTAETDEFFRLDYNDGVVKFLRDPSGVVTGFAYEGEMGRFQFKKLPG